MLTVERACRTRLEAQPWPLSFLGGCLRWESRLGQAHSGLCLRVSPECWGESRALRVRETLGAATSASGCG